MFKLIKMCAYGLFAYFIYEMVQGMTAEIEKAAKEVADKGASGAKRSRGAQQSSSASQNRGVPVQVQDSSGAMSTRRAGRGVIHR